MMDTGRESATDDRGDRGDRIELRGLEWSCIIGCYERERTEPQPVVVDIRLHMPPADPAPDTSMDLGRTFDYARLAGVARFLLERGRFSLLESAALALCRIILAPPTADAPHIRPLSASVRIAKPRALGGNGIPSVTTSRRAADLVYRQERKPFGLVDILHEQPDVGIYRLRVFPGCSIDTHVHRVLREDELILGDRLLLQGRPVAAGHAFAWPHDHPHRYDNPADTEQSILCIDRPAFFPADERVVPEAEKDLVPVPGEVFFSPMG